MEREGERGRSYRAWPFHAPLPRSLQTLQKGTARVCPLSSIARPSPKHWGRDGRFRGGSRRRRRRGGAGLLGVWTAF